MTELENLKEQIRNYEIPGYTKNIITDKVAISSGGSYTTYSISFIPDNKDLPIVVLKSTYRLDEELVKADLEDRTLTVESKKYSYELESPSDLFETSKFKFLMYEGNNRTGKIVGQEVSSLVAVITALNTIASGTKNLEDTDLELQYTS